MQAYIGTAAAGRKASERRKSSEHLLAYAVSKLERNFRHFFHNFCYFSVILLDFFRNFAKFLPEFLEICSNFTEIH